MNTSLNRGAVFSASITIVDMLSGITTGSCVAGLALDLDQYAPPGVRDQEVSAHESRPTSGRSSQRH